MPVQPSALPAAAESMPAEEAGDQHVHMLPDGSVTGPPMPMSPDGETMGGMPRGINNFQCTSPQVKNLTSGYRYYSVLRYGVQG